MEVSKRDESNYSIAIQICTKPTNQEKLKKNSKTPVTDGGWNAKVQSYRSEGVDNLAIPTISDKSNATEQQIKEWCKETLEKEIEDDEITYNKVAKWCANP